MPGVPDILDRFVDCFIDDFTGPEFDGPLVIRQHTEPVALDGIYSRIPIKFPLLYENLILRYRWHGADFDLMRLLLNPPGQDLSGLELEMFQDPALSQECLNAGFVQMGRAADGYDPVCFDTNRPTGKREFPIVVLDHEEILCNSRIRVISKLASSFEELVELATSKNKPGPT